MVMGPSAAAGSNPKSAPILIEPLPAAAESGAADSALPTQAIEFDDEPALEFAPVPDAADERAPAEQSHPLAALSYEERIALFT